MSYDPTNEIIQYLQYRLNFLEDDLISNQMRRNKNKALQESGNILKRFVGLMLSLLSLSEQGITDLKTEINQYGKAIKDLRDESFDGAIQVLESLQGYFAYGPERDILLEYGPNDTRFEKIQLDIQHLKTLQAKKLDMLQIS